MDFFILYQTTKEVESENLEEKKDGVSPKVNWQLRFWPERQLNARRNHYSIAEVTLCSRIVSAIPI